MKLNSLLILHLFCSLPASYSQNYAIQGAIILTDPKIAANFDMSKLKKGQRLESKEAYLKEAQKRVATGRAFAASLPFPVQEWWSVQTSACPPLKRDKKMVFGKPRGNDRGVAFAHLQIWDNFLYEGRHNLSSSSSRSSEEDILVIFEDDAVSAVTNLTHSLLSELRSMDTDLLFLGWCKGPGKHFPMCAHAYAVTRRGVEKMRLHYDVCGTAIDGQFLTMCNMRWISYRKAKPENYADSLRPGADTHTTKGIVVQAKGVVSFNYHWWDPSERNSSEPS